MYLKKSIVLFFILALPCSFARDLKIYIMNRSFSIEFNKELLTFKDDHSDLSISHKACNAHIIERANRELSKILKETLVEKDFPHSFVLELDGKKYFDKIESSRGKFFANFSDYMKFLKTEEELNCKK